MLLIAGMFAFVCTYAIVTDYKVNVLVEFCSTFGPLPAFAGNDW